MEKPTYTMGDIAPQGRAYNGWATLPSRHYIIYTRLIAPCRTQPLTTAGEELDDLVHDLSDMTET